MTVLLGIALRGKRGKYHVPTANASPGRQDHRGDWPRRFSISSPQDWLAKLITALVDGKRQPLGLASDLSVENGGTSLHAGS